jgi:hypothetical protein
MTPRPLLDPIVYTSAADTGSKTSEVKRLDKSILLLYKPLVSRALPPAVVECVNGL